MIKRFLKAMWRALRYLLSGRNPFVSNEVYAMRLSTCMVCDNYDRCSKRCDLCGCFVYAKTRLKTEMCSDEKNPHWNYDL